MARTAKGSSRTKAGVEQIQSLSTWPLMLSIVVECPEGLRAKERNEQVLQWLRENNKSIPKDIAKAVQKSA